MNRRYWLGIGVGVGTPTAGGCKKVEFCYCCGDGVLAVACIDLIRG